MQEQKRLSRHPLNRVGSPVHRPVPCAPRRLSGPNRARPKDNFSSQRRLANGGMVRPPRTVWMAGEDGRFDPLHRFFLRRFSTIISYVQSFTYRGRDYAEMPIMFHTDVTCSGTAIPLLHLQQLFRELVTQAQSAALGHGRSDSVGNIGR